MEVFPLPLSRVEPGPTPESYFALLEIILPFLLPRMLRRLWLPAADLAGACRLSPFVTQ